MRRLTLTGLAMMAVFIAVGCQDSPDTNLLEPSFGKVNLPCGTITEETLLGLYADIDRVYENAPNSTRTSVKSHVGNIANEACDGDWAQAKQKAWTALQQIDQQVGDLFLTGPPELVEDLAQLWTDIFALTCQPGEECVQFPAGAFEATGGIGKVNPRKGGAVRARNGEGAVDVDQDDFSGSDEVFLVLSRIDDDEVDAGLYPGYSSFREGYYIFGSYDAEALTGEVLVQMCVDVGALPPGLLFGDLKIGHVDDGTLTLLDPVTEGLIVEDACAGLYGQAPEPTSNWLKSIGRFAGTTIRKVFGPEPLYAWRGVKRGLGGLTGTFSPFAPMYSYQDFLLNEEGQGTVLVTPPADYPVPGYPVHPDSNCTGEDCYPVDAVINLEAEAAPGWMFAGWAFDGSTGETNCGEEPVCYVTMDRDGVSVTATFVPATTTLTADLTNLATGPFNVTVQVSGDGYPPDPDPCRAVVDDGIVCDFHSLPIGATVILTATPEAVSGPWDMAFSGGCVAYESGKGEGFATCTILDLPADPDPVSITFSH